MTATKRFNEECWVDEQHRIISFHNVKDFTHKFFGSHQDLLVYIIKKSKIGYKIQYW